MTLPEWIEPYAAVRELSELWNIPGLIAEDIIRHVMQSGEVPVRGVPDASFALRIISKEIAGSMYPGHLFVFGFRDVEIESAGLLQYGRKLIPSEYGVPSEAPKRSLIDKGANQFAAQYIAAEQNAVGIQN
jgi:hypothetical protein